MLELLFWFIFSAHLQTPVASPLPQLLPIGLVEITMTIGHFNAGSADPAPIIVRRRMCITPQTVPPELVDKASHLCKSSNIVRESGHTSMDLICQGISSHLDTQTISPELARTSMHTIIPSQDHTLAVDSTSEYRLLNPSCGSGKPGQVVPVP